MYSPPQSGRELNSEMQNRRLMWKFKTFSKILIFLRIILHISLFFYVDSETIFSSSSHNSYFNPGYCWFSVTQTCDINLFHSAYAWVSQQSRRIPCIPSMQMKVNSHNSIKLVEDYQDVLVTKWLQSSCIQTCAIVSYLTCAPRSQTIGFNIHFCLVHAPNTFCLVVQIHFCLVVQIHIAWWFKFTFAW